MAGALISDYAVGTPKWTQMLETQEKQRKGKMALSLTNYDNDNLPAIEAGSYIEIGGALYGFAAEEAIGGAPTTANINYIVVDPTPITASWSIVAPTWSAAKNGWYDVGEAKRYIGGCRFDTPNYRGKWVYGGDRNIKILHNDCVFEKTIYRYYAVSLAGFAESGITLTGAQIIWPGAITGNAFCPVNLPHEAVVINLYSYAIVPDNFLTVSLMRSERDSTDDDTMATNSHTEDGFLNDGVIDYATIDNIGYSYFLRGNRGISTDAANLYGAIIAYTITEPKP